MRWARDNVNDASGRTPTRRKVQGSSSDEPHLRSEAKPLPSALRLPWLWGHHSLFLLSAQATLLEWQVGGNPARPWDRFWRERGWENEGAASVYSLPGSLTSLQALAGSMTLPCLCTQRRDAPGGTGVILPARG